MKKFHLTVLFLLCSLFLAGCFCQHQWQPADCLKPETCIECGKTQGELGDHSWLEADCTLPRRCSICQATQGDPLGHSWVEANCQAPKTCSVCGVTEGSLGDHIWLDATTEAPQTCSLCSATTGEKLVTDPRFTTPATKQFHGIWTCRYTFTGQELGLTDYIDQVPCTLYYQFGPTGELVADGEPQDMEAFVKAVEKLALQFIYENHPDPQTADAEMLALKGMSAAEYAEKIAPLSADALLDSFFPDGVYYVEEGQIFLSKTWTDAFAPYGFTVTDDTMSIEKSEFFPLDSSLVWHRSSN